MNKFPSINQYRHVCLKVNHRAKDDASKLLTFTGTVKLHGSNAAIVVEPLCSRVPYKFSFQSRERIITPEDDNFGFARYMSERSEVLNKLIADNFHLSSGEKLILYGEWCGGKVTKDNVAIRGLEKMFVIFAIKFYEAEPELDDEGVEVGYWLDIANPHYNLKSVDNRIFNSHMFETFKIKIDFNNPQASTNEMIALTKAVEAICPVGKYFGVEGVGEGIVWRCDQYSTSDLWFKVKGEKHSVSKVKTLVEVDPVKLASVTEFVDRVVTQPRVDQGIAYLVEQGKTIDRTSTGDFLSWFFADVMKEESDVLKASGLTKKDVSSKIGSKARALFFTIVDNP